MRKKICFIATGGTIASSNQGNGFMPSMAAESLISAVPQLAAMCDIDFLQLLQLDSSNLVPQHWQKMAMAVISRYDDYDGFVISHGTDTMAYTAAALYYMLVNIGKPVVLTGSQLPMENPKTDAKGNLLTAFHTAVSGCPGVFLAFSSISSLDLPVNSLCLAGLVCLISIRYRSRYGKIISIRSKGAHAILSMAV